MSRTPHQHLLARLRGSARLAIFVLLVFALKIGVAAACVKHDFAESGLGGSAAAEVLQVDAVPSGDDGTPLDFTGTCTHCACHHAAALLPEFHTALPVGPEALHTRVWTPPSNAPPRFELRPPIA